MPISRFLGPVRPETLRKQAKRLLRTYRNGQAESRAMFRDFHPDPPSPSAAKLSDAQLVLARSHDFPGWPRMMQGVALFNAILDDDAETVLDLLRKRPELLKTPVNGVTSNWGPPLACAAQLGRQNVLDALLAIRGQDLNRALDRAVLKGRTAMARQLIESGAEPEPGLAMGPAESLNVTGLRFLRDIGVPLTDASGDALAPVAVVLEGYYRNPPAKHACLAFFEETGIRFPDTPVMAIHFGRLDRLKEMARDNPGLLHRHYHYDDIWPLSLGCHEDRSLALHGTPLDGSGLLHICMDFDEEPIADWLLQAGASLDFRAEKDGGGFGGHTPLFNALVSQANRTSRKDDGLARMLLNYGADLSCRASIKKAIRFHDDESEHIYKNMTVCSYAQAFHAKEWVNDKALALCLARQ